MAAASLSSSSPASALRRLSCAPRASRFSQPKRFDRVRRFYPAAIAAMSTSSGTKEATANNPGLQAEIDPATKGYFMQQTHRQSMQECKTILELYRSGVGSAIELGNFSTPVLGHEVSSVLQLVGKFVHLLGAHLVVQMFRVKDPKVSLNFYSRVMGMSLLKRLDFPDMKFSLYFLGYEDVSAAPADPVQRTGWTFGQKATIELTHN